MIAKRAYAVGRPHGRDFHPKAMAHWPVLARMSRCILRAAKTFGRAGAHR
jgi:hypothetical protein